MVSICSIMLSLFNSSLMTIILMSLRRNTSFLQRFGLSPLIVLARCCVIRILFPIAFFGHTFLLQDKCPLPVGSLERFSIFLSFKSLLLFVWLFGFLVCFFFLISRGIKLRGNLYQNAILAEDHVNALLDKIDPNCPMKIYVSPDITVPLTAGILHPHIYLPDYKYNLRDLNYIILHEYNHWKNKDTLTKIMLHLFHAIMWWNLITYFIIREYNSILELDCDFSMCNNFSPMQKVEYIQTLQKSLLTMRNHLQKRPQKSDDICTLTNKRNIKNSNLYQRIALMSYKENKHYKMMQTILSSLFLIWLAISYC